MRQITLFWKGCNPIIVKMGWIGKIKLAALLIGSCDVLRSFHPHTPSIIKQQFKLPGSNDAYAFEHF
jgi:hypothetical protein